MRHKKKSAIDSPDFENAAALRDKEVELFNRRISPEQRPIAVAARYPSLVTQLDEVKAALERLRAILRDTPLNQGAPAKRRTKRSSGRRPRGSK